MRHLRPALLLGMVAALLIAIRIALRGENWSDRALQLVFIWFAGGVLGSLAASVVLAGIARLGLPRLAQFLRSVAFLPAFLAVASLVFLVQNRFAAGGYELNPERPVLSFVFSSLQVIAVFLFSVPNYLLPWMAPAMVLAGYALLPAPAAGAKG